MSIQNILNFLKKPIFISLFTAISSDPSPTTKWTHLYSNIFFRFIFIFTVLYQTNSNVKESFMLTVTTITFFYLISSKEEKKKILSDNFKKEDINTFLYFIVFMFVIVSLKKNIV